MRCFRCPLALQATQIIIQPRFLGPFGHRNTIQEQTLDSRGTLILLEPIYFDVVFAEHANSNGSINASGGTQGVIRLG